MPDRAAHAWVEVWVDGFGWYPVEVTPPAAFTWYEQGVLSLEGLPSEEAEESEIPEESDPLEESGAPEDSERPGDTPAPTQAASAPPQGQGGGNSLPAAAPAVFGALAAILGAAALLWLGQHLPKRRRARRMAGPERTAWEAQAYTFFAPPTSTTGPLCTPTAACSGWSAGAVRWTGGRWSWPKRRNSASTP